MTTHSLNISDGTITLELNDLATTKAKILSWTPGISVNGEPIREVLQVHFFDALANNIANLRTLNKLLEQARNYARTQTGPRVYLNYDPGDAGTDYRSMVFTGEVRNLEQLLGIFYTRERFTFEIEIVREPWWEGALTQLPLTNGSATDNTAGITVNNVDDATGDNFVTIDGVNDMIGDMPAPIKLEMYNSLNTTDETDEIYLTHNVYSTPGSLAHILEGESATGAGVASTPEGAAGASANNYAAISWTATAETKIATWALSSALLGNAKGGRFLVLARWYGDFPYTDCWLRLKLEGASGVLWEDDLRLVSSTRELFLIGVVKLPPYLPQQANLKAINLCMYALRNQSGTHTINLDYLMLGSVSGNAGWKRFKALDAGIGYQEYFYHDATEEFDYRVDTSSNKIAELTAYGGPILLVPGVDQRLYFLTCNNAKDCAVEQTWTVKLWYRPRRHSL